MDYSLDDLCNHSKCYIIPTRPLYPAKETNILNETFTAWKKCWQEVEGQTEFKFNEDDFFRQDAILSLVGPRGEIIGCHLYSFFNLFNTCSTDFSFFKRFDSKYINHLRNNQLNNTFSIEYLTVSKEFRGNGILSFGRAIIALSCKVLEYSFFDGILAQTRDDLRVDKMTMESGGELVSTGFQMNGIDSSFVAFDKTLLKQSPKENVAKFVDSVWTRKSDFKGITRNSNINNNNFEAKL